MVQAIRASQERYRAENQQYFGDSSRWCPSEGVGEDERHAFFSTTATRISGRRCGPTCSEVFSSATASPRVPGDALPSASDIITSRKFPSGTTPSEPWYVVQAKADADDDGTFCAVVATSFNPDVVVENETE